MKTENLTPAIKDLEFGHNKACRSFKVDRFKERQKLPPLVIEMAGENQANAIPLPPPQLGQEIFYRL